MASETHRGPVEQALLEQYHDLMLICMQGKYVPMLMRLSGFYQQKGVRHHEELAHLLTDLTRCTLDLKNLQGPELQQAWEDMRRRVQELFQAGPLTHAFISVLMAHREAVGILEALGQACDSGEPNRANAQIESSKQALTQQLQDVGGMSKRQAGEAVEKYIGALKNVAHKVPRSEVVPFKRVAGKPAVIQSFVEQVSKTPANDALRSAVMLACDAHMRILPIGDAVDKVTRLMEAFDKKHISDEARETFMDTLGKKAASLRDDPLATRRLIAETARYFDNDKEMGRTCAEFAIIHNYAYALASHITREYEVGEHTGVRDFGSRQAVRQWKEALVDRITAIAGDRAPPDAVRQEAQRRVNELEEALRAAAQKHATLGR